VHGRDITPSLAEDVQRVLKKRGTRIARGHLVRGHHQTKIAHAKTKAFWVISSTTEQREREREQQKRGEREKERKRLNSDRPKFWVSSMKFAFGDRRKQAERRDNIAEGKQKRKRTGKDTRGVRQP